jgi:phage/plasmid-like protein (TIGR03299 family)
VTTSTYPATQLQQHPADGILIGYTGQRGTAHTFAANHHSEPNGYPAGIPRADIERRLFGWTPEIWETTASQISPSGVTTLRTDPACVRPPGTWGPDDPGVHYAHFKAFEIHPYTDVLLDQIERITDQGLGIAGAGMAHDGGIAWIQVEMPDNITTSTGEAHRPYLNCATSLTGRIATTYLTGTTLIRCSNAMSTLLAPGGANRVKVRHTKGSVARVADIRNSLDLVLSAGDRFNQQWERFLNTTVTDTQWEAFVHAHEPLTLPTGTPKRGASLTNARNRQARLNTVAHTDPRCADLFGTAMGVIQTVNTIEAHYAPIRRGADREVRNAVRAATGAVDALDTQTLRTLQHVLAA